VIVMITGEEDPTVMARAFQAGDEFFLFKLSTAASYCD